jgi:hypothetical protein
MSSQKLTTTGMVAVSCLFALPTLCNLYKLTGKNTVRIDRNLQRENHGILAAIEFVSTKMTVSFSKESLRSFFFQALGAMSRCTHIRMNICYTGFNLHNSTKKTKKVDIATRKNHDIRLWSKNLIMKSIAHGAYLVHPRYTSPCFSLSLQPAVSRWPSTYTNTPGQGVRRVTPGTHTRYSQAQK